MHDFIFKRINHTDEKEVRDLVRNVFGTLERKDFLIPWTEEQMNRFFDDDYSLLYGAYDDNKLIAISQLFTEKEIEEEYYDILNVDKSKSMCELGGFLVLIPYRNKGIMTKLSEMQYELAKKSGFDYIISTAHPDNIESNKILQKLKLNLFGTITSQSGYLRNLYWAKLKD